MFDRCISIVTQQLAGRASAANGQPTEPEPDRDFIICSLDVIAGERCHFVSCLNAHVAHERPDRCFCKQNILECIRHLMHCASSHKLQQQLQMSNVHAVSHTLCNICAFEGLTADLGMAEDPGSSLHCP